MAQGNRPPDLAPLAPVVGTAGLPLSIEVSAADPDGGALYFEVANAPSGAVLTDVAPGMAVLSWLPAPDQVGNHDLIFTVTDDATPPASDSERVLVTIGPGNRPPVLTPIGNYQYEPDVQVTIELAASDPDLDDLIYSVIGGPSVEAELEDRGDGTGRWYWFVPEGSATYELTFTVTDRGQPAASVSETIVLSPLDANRPPELAAIGDRRVRAGEALFVSFSASDPDGDGLAFSAAGLPEGAEFADLGGGAAALNWTPAASDVGEHALVVAVADNRVPSEVDSEPFRIVVEAPPAVPTGDLRLDKVVWHAPARVLYAIGSGARPRETVSILDAETGALLGVSRANARGRFGMAVAPFLAPCAVNVRVLEEQSAAHPVQRAPRDCGRRPLTRIRDVKWICKRSELRLDASRAPAGGTIEVSDASSGAALGSLAADHHGNVRGSLKLAAPPTRVRLTARFGDARWELGAAGVDGCRDRCARDERGHRKGR